MDVYVFNVVFNLKRGNIIFVIFIMELKYIFLKFLYCVFIKGWNKKYFFKLNEELLFLNL